MSLQESPRSGLSSKQIIARSRYETAWWTFRLAAFGFHLKLTEKLFNPGQPRWPAGTSTGGEWSPSGGGGAGGSVSERPIVRVNSGRARTAGTARVIGGRAYRVTWQQEYLLVNLGSQADVAVRTVQRVDPTWRPRPAAQSSDPEGEIQSLRDIARQAEQRLSEINSGGYGSNSGARIPERVCTPIRVPQEEPWLLPAHRQAVGLPDLGNGRAKTKAEGTTASIMVDGDLLFGENSSATAIFRRTGLYRSRQRRGTALAGHTSAEEPRDHEYPEPGGISELGPVSR